jgi:type I restriction enzyme S subunit
MFERVKDTGHPHETMLSVFRDHGVVQKDSRSNLNVTAHDRSIYQLIDSGWLVVNRMKAWQGSVGISTYRGIVSGHYLCFRPKHQESSRYLNWLLRSAPYAAEYGRLSRGVRPGQAEIDNDQLRRLQVLMPSVVEQERIADFLDEQVGLLDRAATLKERQATLLRELLQSQVDAAVLKPPGLGLAVRRVKAGLVLRVLPGYAFASPEFMQEGGVRLLRGINVRVRGIDWRECVRWGGSDVGVQRRFGLACGDVVMGMDRPWIKGGLRIARLGPADVPALLLQRVACLRSGRELDPDYMFWAFQATRFRDEVEGQLTGLSVPHISGEQIEEHRIVLPDRGVQQSIAARLDRLEMEVSGADAVLQRSRDLLQERKQALITAAVTGEFDVTSARSAA